MTFPSPRHKKQNGHHYIFKEMEDFTHQTNWRLQQPFCAEWLEISTGGLVRVKANASGYAWDGCTPKYSLLDLVVVGIPDGHIDVRIMRPFTYRASMVHDALYQYLDTVPVHKRDIDLLFLTLLGDFRLRHLYYCAVKYLGGWGIVQRGVHAGQFSYSAAPVSQARQMPPADGV